MNFTRFFSVLSLLIASTNSAGFESDVHYGLTQWLALQAGFDQQAAQTIATGNQRVDSGDMQYLELVFVDACLGSDAVGTRLADEHHYPSAGATPGSPQQRMVVPGSDAAKKAAIAVTKVSEGQASYMLFKLGEALHILQDSWSHQGIPDIPQPAQALFACDAALAWGHPKSRGGWNSHKADLSMYWPADTLAMAKATYDVMAQYPLLAGAKRTPRGWDEIRPLLDRFVAASTKTEKTVWFVGQGIRDVSFLEGISLGDGAKPFELKWSGRKLPPLASAQSRQHGVDADLLDFYNRFFAQWAVTEDFEALASAYGPEGHAADAKQRSRSSRSVSKAELAGRLKVWRLRDHGRVAEIAHSLLPLTARQLLALDAIGKERNAYARYDSPSNAFFPLLPRGKDVSPLLPFFVSTAMQSKENAPRAVAVAKFRHVPYDTVGVVAEKSDGGWRVLSIVSTVDH